MKPQSHRLLLQVAEQETGNEQETGTGPILFGTVTYWIVCERAGVRNHAWRLGWQLLYNHSGGMGAASNAPSRIENSGGGGSIFFRRAVDLQPRDVRLQFVQLGPALKI